MNRVLVVKELKGFLKNPQFIASVLLMPIIFVAMGEATAYGVEKARELREQGLMILDMDNTNYSKLLVYYLQVFAGAKPVDSRPQELPPGSVLLVIPRGFGQAIEDALRGGKAIVEVGVEASIQSISLSGLAPIEASSRLIPKISEFVRNMLLEYMGIEPGDLDRVSIVPDARVYIGSRELRLGEATGIVNSLTLSYFVILILIALSAQFATLSMAQEKEQKTFEMLLAQPISRSHIGVAKIIAVITVSLIEALVFALAWYYYLSSARAVGPEAPGEGSIAGGSLLRIFLDMIGGGGLALFIASITLSMFAASILGLVLGGLARDTKTAGVFIGPLWIITMFTGIAAQFTGLPSGALPLLLMGLLVIPGPLAIMNSALKGSLGLAAGILALEAVTTILLLALLARFLNSDVIVTGLRFRGPRGRS